MKLAAGRPLSGPANAGARAGLRTEAQMCDALFGRVNTVSPTLLQALIGGGS
jgi:hypothetical protein